MDRGERGSNRGSTTVEMAFVMPIVLMVIVLVIYLMFDAMNDSVVRGNAYTAIYTYRDREKADLGDRLSENIGGTMIGSDSGLSVAAGPAKGCVYAEVSVTGGQGGYSYRAEPMRFETEYGKTADRLRRWQFYGNVLWE